MKMKTNLNRRPHDPFDDSATQRQQRMGLLTPDGQINTSAVNTLSRVYAGLLFDTLCDSYSDAEAVTELCREFANVECENGTRSALLELCVLYDGLRLTLPEPIWWIVGNDSLLAPFMSGFSACLAALSGRMEVMN